MAICSDMLTRYKDETKRHGKIPQAIVWVTGAGSGTSSAPCFNKLGISITVDISLGAILPTSALSNLLHTTAFTLRFSDIILTGITASPSRDAMSKLKILHHEYTHFLHCVYASNKNKFWNDIVLSELGCTIADVTLSLLNAIFKSNLSTGYNGFYNFNNPYVYFAENYAEWYSLVGCYGKGLVGTGISGDGTVVTKIHIPKERI